MNSSSGSIHSPRTTQLFAADWHPQLLERLAVFPRSITAPPGLGVESFWPDLATFIEDDEQRLLMYYAEGSPWSVQMVYCRRHDKLVANLYWDCELVRQERGYCTLFRP
jgi:hypothetical protein